eukprot:3403165-Prymnesium_polylepis.1
MQPSWNLMLNAGLSVRFFLETTTPMSLCYTGSYTVCYTGSYTVCERAAVPPCARAHQRLCVHLCGSR